MVGLLLFCALSTAPMDCDKASARWYERVPGANALPFMCLRQAEIWAAEHGLEPKSGQYLKVTCSRHEFGAKVG